MTASDGAAEEGVERARAAAREELARLAGMPEVRSAGILILDPRDGRILATAATPGAPMASSSIPTASTMKTLLVAAALEAGLDPRKQFARDGGEWKVQEGVTLRDSGGEDALDAFGVIARSSNVAAGRMAQEIGATRVLDLLEAMGWRESLAEGMPAAVLPAREEWNDGRAFAWSAGHGLQATLLHLASSYAVFANGGSFIAPTRDGTGTRKRVVSAATAALVLKMLEEAVGPDAMGRQAAVPGVRVGGKTGTAGPLVAGSGGSVANFVGIAPVDAPRFVIVVSAEVEGRGYHGGTVSAPSFARLVRALTAP